MYRSLLLVIVAACAVEPAPEELASTTQALSATRDHVAGDVYHYSFTLRVGSGPNAVLHVDRVVRERAPWVPRHSSGAVMMLHGDFATFATNFLPGVAPWLAERGLDVWGVDRRWAHATDTTDFATMGLAQELDDIGIALGFARATRLVTDGSVERLALVGFSRGGELAYFYAAREATRPALQRHVKAIVPLDVYVSLPADEPIRASLCEGAAIEQEIVAGGEVDSPNDFQIALGQGALATPDAQNPFQGFYPGLTFREAVLALVGQTYQVFQPSPVYHFNGPTLADGAVTGLRFSPEPVIDRWLANAPPHQAWAESADTDAQSCGDAPPLDLPLSRIRVPLLLIAVAGGYGERALFSTTQVGSPDVTTRVIRQLPVAQEAEDFGHADLLYAPAAEALAWQPLLAWLSTH